MYISTDITPDKMTFLTANYGLTPEQVVAFAEGFNSAYSSMAGEIEYAWEEGGWYPEDPESAMIECLLDADRLEQYIEGYMEWCFNFYHKTELLYDLRNERPPEWCLSHLEREGKSYWLAAK